MAYGSHHRRSGDERGQEDGHARDCGEVRDVPRYRRGHALTLDMCDKRGDTGGPCGLSHPSSAREPTPRTEPERPPTSPYGYTYPRPTNVSNVTSGGHANRTGV
ncbi:hypothetical protein TUSST3_27360 [Streptomyces sp. TUS-ST3]|nr:hypothetical protein TUSST3_27360 [Streptomyces sp. TUS-ST3]